MTTQEFKTYRNISAVTQFRIKDTEQKSWGYGFPDMLQREKDIKTIGVVKRIIAFGEKAVLKYGHKGRDIECWALVELDNSRIVKIEGYPQTSIIDCQLAQVVSKGKPGFSKLCLSNTIERS